MLTKPDPSLAEIASRYATVNTRHTLTAANTEQILKNDPNRWGVIFSPGLTFGANNRVQPGPNPFDITNGIPVSWPQVFLYKDFPSQVTGEWFFTGTVGDDIVISECVYLE